MYSAGDVRIEKVPAAVNQVNASVNSRRKKARLRSELAGDLRDVAALKARAGEFIL